MIRKLFTAAALTAIALTPACAQDSASGKMNRAEVEQIVREYIVENPQIIEDALVALGEQQRAEAAAAAKTAIKTHKDKLYSLHRPGRCRGDCCRILRLPLRVLQALGRHDPGIAHRL